MIGVEFGSPRSPGLRASWNLLETARSGLFSQLIVIPLFNEYRLLTQVAGHGDHTIKLLPSLTISDEDCGWIEQSFEAVIAGAHRTTGAVWKLGKTLVGNAVRARSTAPLRARGVVLRLRTGRPSSDALVAQTAVIASTSASRPFRAKRFQTFYATVSTKPPRSSREAAVLATDTGRFLRP